MTTKNKQALLLAAHGSKSDQWNDLLRGIEKKTRAALKNQLPDTHVHLGYFQTAAPTIPDVLRSFEQEGIEDVVVMPLLLCENTHYFLDLPYLLGQSINPELDEKFRKVDTEPYRGPIRCRTTPSLRQTGFLAKVYADRFRELADDPGDTTVVLPYHAVDTFAHFWGLALGEVERALKATGAEETIRVLVHLQHNEQFLKVVDALAESSAQTLVMPFFGARGVLYDVIHQAMAAYEEHENVTMVQEGLFESDDFPQWIARYFLELQP